MRKHIVKCQVEGNVEEFKQELQCNINLLFSEIIEKKLLQSELSKEEKIDLIDNLIKEVKKNNH